MAILSDEEVREALARRPAWRRIGDTLVRERALRDFAQALAFLERIGQAVEDYGRHPDIAITGGNRVRIMVSNANAAGITDAELRLVDKVDQVPTPRPSPKPRGALAAVAASASARRRPSPRTPSRSPTSPTSPRRGGRAARIVAGIGGLAVGAAALFAARRR